MDEKNARPSSKLEVQYAEIFKQLTTTFGPLPDNTSLAQPSPFKVLPTLVTYGVYEKPIVSEEITCAKLERDSH